MKLTDRSLWALALVLASPTMASAADVPAPRLITVTGKADVHVNPDEVIITVGVESVNKDIAAAIAQNSERVKRLSELAVSFKIDRRYVQTAYLSVQPEYEEYPPGNPARKKHELVGYTARRTMAMTLKDMPRFDEFLQALIKSGATSIQGVQFCTTSLRKYKDQARASAMTAAHEKAQGMAAAVGARIGKPSTIREDQDTWSVDNNSNYSQNGNESQNSGDSETTATVGQIAISARVTVVFDLE